MKEISTLQQCHTCLLLKNRSVPTNVPRQRELRGCYLTLPQWSTHTHNSNKNWVAKRWHFLGFDFRFKFLFQSNKTKKSSNSFRAVKSRYFKLKLSAIERRIQNAKTFLKCNYATALIYWSIFIQNTVRNNMNQGWKVIENSNCEGISYCTFSILFARSFVDQILRKRQCLLLSTKLMRQKSWDFLLRLPHFHNFW